MTPVKKFNDFHVIDEDTEIDFGGTVVSFFPTTYSIPESLGVVLKTAEGSIVYTGDFKFDQTASESMRQTSLVWQKSVVTASWLSSVIRQCRQQYSGG